MEYPKTIIFDLDYTLLDSKKLKEEGLALFFGMTAGEFSDFYEKNFKKRNINYDPREHIRMLALDAEEDKKMEELVEFIKNKIGDYLLPGAKGLLKQLKDGGNRLVLMTYGDLNWHKLKINSLPEIKKYFDKVILTDKDKSEHDFLRSLADKGEKIIIINDKAAESLRMKEVLGDCCEVCLIKGPYSGNIKGGMNGVCIII